MGVERWFGLALCAASVVLYFRSRVTPTDLEMQDNYERMPDNYKRMPVAVQPQLSNQSNVAYAMRHAQSSRSNQVRPQFSNNSNAFRNSQSTRSHVRFADSHGV